VLLDEHARTYPTGVLAEERSAERVLTLCKLGRKAQARTEAARFLRATPDSPLAQSIRSSCGTFDEEGGR
jgi:RNA polymerase sigma-70 factor (ECF subfamily)